MLCFSVNQLELIGAALTTRPLLFVFDDFLSHEMVQFCATHQSRRYRREDSKLWTDGQMAIQKTIFSREAVENTTKSLDFHDSLIRPTGLFDSSQTA